MQYREVFQRISTEGGEVCVLMGGKGREDYSAYFGNSAEFWIGIQSEYDLRRERVAIKEELEQIVTLERVV